MASSTVQKSPCTTCGKAAGILTCRGCGKDYCTRHVIEHRQALGQQMDEITLAHDQLRQSLSEQTAELHRHPLMKQIEEWEQKSIEKIHQAADDARKQLLNEVKEHTKTMTEILEDLTRQLSKARDDDDFVETDLKQWMDKLDKLKKDLAASSMIKIRQDNSKIPFISKVVIIDGVSIDRFEQSAGDIHIEENGQVIVHSKSEGHAAVRGRGDYLTGQHRFRFKIEQLGASKWIFFGIKSRDAPMVADSANTRTAYGWAGGNAVCLDGYAQCNYNGYKSDFELNDLIELFIDCDRQMMRLTNERTHSTFELNVDATKCPFPWQLNLGLHYPNNRVRMIDNELRS